MGNFSPLSAARRRRDTSEANRLRHERHGRRTLFGQARGMRLPEDFALLLAQNKINLTRQRLALVRTAMTMREATPGALLAGARRECPDLTLRTVERNWPFLQNTLAKVRKTT